MPLYISLCVISSETFPDAETWPITAGTTHCCGEVAFALSAPTTYSAVTP